VVAGPDPAAPQPRAPQRAPSDGGVSLALRSAAASALVAAAASPVHLATLRALGGVDTSLAVLVGLATRGAQASYVALGPETAALRRDVAALLKKLKVSQQIVAVSAMDPAAAPVVHPASAVRSLIYCPVAKVGDLDTLDVIIIKPADWGTLLTADTLAELCLANRRQSLVCVTNDAADASDVALDGIVETVGESRAERAARKWVHQASPPR